MRPALPSSAALVCLQIGMMLVMLLGLALYPPARGRMILLPVTADGAATMLAQATGTGALLVGRGPLPHSFVVEGDRAALAGLLLRHGVLLLAAPPAGCGASAPGDAA